MYAAPANPDGSYWVAVRCHFSCRACGHVSPLNHLDVDGSVQCLSCGTEQKFQVRQWRQLVEHAHAVGDLAGPHPEGRAPSSVSIGSRNPFAEIGRTTQFAEVNRGETNQKKHELTLRAAPGHPLSAKGMPLQVVSRTEKEITLRSPDDGSTATYSLPGQTAAWGLVGVVAEAHVKGRGEARVSDGGGALALTCPSCSAPLTVTAASTLVTCTYCSTSCMVPSAARRRLGGGDLPALVWWMLFAGPSPARTGLERDVGREASEAQQARDGDSAQRDLEAERARQRAERAAEERVAKERAAASRRTASIVVVLVALVGAPAFGFLSWYIADRGSRPSPLVAQAAAPAAPVAPEPAPNPALAQFDLVWDAKVKKAEGKPLRPGDSCQLSMTTDTKKISRFVITCAGDVVYDLSQSPGSGMTNLGWAFVEAVGDAPGTFQYGIALNDMGQRTGRPQLQLNSGSKEAHLTQPNLPTYSIALDVPPLSLPRAGEAVLFPKTMDLARQRAEATVEEVEGAAGVKVGDACGIEYGVGMKLPDGYRCYVSLRCGKRWLYPGAPDRGLADCQLDGEGRPVTANDNEPTEKDGDPRVEISPPMKRAVYRDEKKGKALRVAVRW